MLEMSQPDCGRGRNAVLTLSIGVRPFVVVTRPLLELYAMKVDADLHVIESMDHPALRPHRMQLQRSVRFLKLPLLTYFLQRHVRILFLDDDVVLSPAMPNLFVAVSCADLGAVIEQHKPQPWHAMHWRAACELYQVPKCAPHKWTLFNSGVMLLTQQTHLPILLNWSSEKLGCRILCDQLYINAVMRRAQARIHDLGGNFNFVGSELRRALTENVSDSRKSRSALTILARRVALRNACILHLTRKVPKLYSAHWIAQRALRARDVLQCGPNASWPSGHWREAMLSKLPKLDHKYDIGHEMCARQGHGCMLLPWAARNATDSGSKRVQLRSSRMRKPTS